MVAADGGDGQWAEELDRHRGAQRDAFDGGQEHDPRDQPGGHPQAPAARAASWRRIWREAAAGRREEDGRPAVSRSHAVPAAPTARDSPTGLRPSSPTASRPPPALHGGGPMLRAAGVLVMVDLRKVFQSPIAARRRRCWAAAPASSRWSRSSRLRRSTRWRCLAGLWSSYLNLASTRSTASRTPRMPGSMRPYGAARRRPRRARPRAGSRASWAVRISTLPSGSSTIVGRQTNCTVA